MRAQVSSEFMIVYAVLLTVFVVFFAVYTGGSFNLFQAGDNVAALRDAQSMAAAMDYVYLAGDGASYRMAIGGGNITISGYAVTSTRPHGSASAPLLNGNVEQGAVNGSDVVITSNQGGVDISG